MHWLGIRLLQMQISWTAQEISFIAGLLCTVQITDRQFPSLSLLLSHLILMQH